MMALLMMTIQILTLIYFNHYIMALISFFSILFLGTFSFWALLYQEDNKTIKSLLLCPYGMDIIH